MNPKKSYTGSIIGLVILLSLVFAANHFKSVLMPPVDIQLALDPQCDLRKAACHSFLKDGGEVRFEISPNSLPVLKPLTVTLTVKEVEVSQAQLNLVGINMDMGINLTVLTQNSPDTFTGIIHIPACMQDKMLWEAQVILKTPNARINVPFRFYSRNK